MSTTTPARRRVKDPEETRRALISSAVELFGRDGYHATSVQRIVDGAELTKGAFYHHFSAKEDLLREIHDRFIDYQLEQSRAVLEARLPAAEALQRFVHEALLEPVARFKPEITVFLQERQFLSSKSFAHIKAKRDEYEDCARTIIQRGVDSGEFREAGPSVLVAFGVIGMSAWAFQWLDPVGPLSAAELSAIYSSVLLDGLRAR